MIESPLLQGLTCYLVMVSNSQNEKLQEAADWLGKADFSTVVECLPGDKASVLDEYASEHDIDLIIMGANGYSRIRQLFIGSNTTTLLRTTKAPLLILR